LEDVQRPCPGLKKCPSLNYVEAFLSNVQWAGTDDSVYLKLRNTGTGEQCTTGELDSAGNSWWTNTWEVYKNRYGELNPCSGFYPVDGEFVFTFKMGSDAISLDKISIDFGEKRYSWSGRAWFQDGDNWMPLK
jgi:hypothetical protein